MSRLAQIKSCVIRQAGNGRRVPDDVARACAAARKGIGQRNRHHTSLALGKEVR